MTRKKVVTLLIALLIVFCIAVAIIDTYILKNDGFGLAFGIGAILLVILLPVVLIMTILVGSAKIAGNLASSKVSANEKKGILKRMLIVFIVAVAAMGVFAVINAIGTVLIDI